MASKAERERKRKSRILAANQNKGGRPRRDGVERYPCGTIDYRGMERQEKVKQTVKDARIRQHGATAETAELPEMGYELGRLYLTGVLGPVKGDAARHMLEAGNRMHDDMQRYYALSGIASPNPRAMDMMSVRGMSGEDRQAACKRAASKMQDIMEALKEVDEQGRPVTVLVRRLVIEDEDTENWTSVMMGKVRRGLAALVKYYGLGARREEAQALVSLH